MKNRMGTFYTDCRVENQVERKKSAEASHLLVDSGAEFTWIKAETLKQIGVKREKKDYTFVMANGQHIISPARLVLPSFASEMPSPRMKSSLASRETCKSLARGRWQA